MTIGVNQYVIFNTFFTIRKKPVIYFFPVALSIQGCLHSLKSATVEQIGDENCQKLQISSLYIFREIVRNIYQHAIEIQPIVYFISRPETARKEHTQVSFTEEAPFLGPALHISEGIQSSAKQVKANKDSIHITKAQRSDRDCEEGIRLTQMLLTYFQYCLLNLTGKCLALIININQIPIRGLFKGSELLRERHFR